jgi:hypothetical protein
MPCHAGNWSYVPRHPDMPRVCVLLCPAGDSRAVLSRAGVAVQVTDDHKPEREDEAVSCCVLCLAAYALSLQLDRQAADLSCPSHACCASGLQGRVGTSQAAGYCCLADASCLQRQHLIRGVASAVVWCQHTSRACSILLPLLARSV